MNIKLIISVMTILLIGGFQSVAASKGKDTLKVGVYSSGAGNIGIIETLKENKAFKVKLINELGFDVVTKYDVIVLGSLSGGLPLKKWRRDLVDYVNCGGGLLLHHNATGFKGWDNSLFPSLFKGIKKYDNQKVSVVIPAHEVVKGIPRNFKHAYYDHIQLKSGADSRIVMKDAAGKPILVVKELGDGKVAGNGMATGFASLPGGKQKNQKAKGGERQLLFNLVRWLGSKKITQLSSEEFKRRENKILLKRASDVSDWGDSSLVSGRGKLVSENMVYEHGYINPPVAVIKNNARFFLFDAGKLSIAYRKTGSPSNMRPQKEIVNIMTRLKWMGITDIIMKCGGPLGIRYRQYLEAMMQGAKEAGVDLWIFWHSTFKLGTKGYEQYLVKEKNGKPGPYVDILSPAFMKRCKQEIDTLVKLDKNGTLKGIFLDEFWHPFVFDKLEDDINKYVAFCKKRFNATPPTDIGKYFAMGNKWHAPEDVWWRRYIIWKNTLIVNFVKKLTKYANSKGLKIINQPFFTPGLRKGWFYGHGDFYGLSREGDLQWTYAPRSSDLLENLPYDKTIFSTHSHYNSGYSNVAMLQGNYGSYFIFQTLWLPIFLGVNPRVIEMFKATVRNNREWYGARPINNVAILVNGIELELTSKDPRHLFMQYYLGLKKMLSSYQDSSMLLVRDVNFYTRYKTLLAPPHSVSHLPAECVDPLMNYVKNGGTLIAMGTEFSTSKEDITDTKNLNPEFMGAKYRKLSKPTILKSITFSDGKRIKIGNTSSRKKEHLLNQVAEPVSSECKVIAVFSETNYPAITKFTCGKGSVIAFHFDVIKSIGNNYNEMMNYLAAVLKKSSSPAITVSGDISIFKTLKKGNWIIISLLGQEIKGVFNRKYPAQGKLFIDPSALGLKGKEFSIYSLAREREILPVQDLRNFGMERWNAQKLKKGIPVYLPADSLEQAILPETIKDKYYRAVSLKYWKTRKTCRIYSHEIIAIAPVGEMSPDVEMNHGK